MILARAMSMYSSRGLAPADHAPRHTLFESASPIITPVSWLLATIAQSYILTTSFTSATYGPHEYMLSGLSFFVSLLGALWMGLDFPANASRSIIDTELGDIPAASPVNVTPQRLILPEQQPLLQGQKHSLFENIRDGEKSMFSRPSYSWQIRSSTQHGDLVREDREVPMVSASKEYLPYFVCGNVFTVVASMLLVYEYTFASQMALLLNLVLQNYAVFIAMHTWKRPELTINKSNWLTHLLSKGTTALVFLLVWKDSGILDNVAPPTIPEMFNSGVMFVLMAIGAGPDPTLAIFLLYDLLVLAYGAKDNATWQAAFQYTALLVTFVMAWDLSGIFFADRGDAEAVTMGEGGIVEIV